jgi:hypothetical protein
VICEENGTDVDRIAALEGLPFFVFMSHRGEKLMTEGTEARFAEAGCARCHVVLPEPEMVLVSKFFLPMVRIPLPGMIEPWQMWLCQECARKRRTRASLMLFMLFLVLLALAYGGRR